MGASRALGLDIGTSAVRAVEISVAKDGPRLERFAEVALPPGAVSGGEILNTGQVTDALRKLRVEGKFKTNKVAIGVANQRVVVRQVDLPWMEADELRAALVYQVQDLLPMPVEDALLDYHPIEEFVGDGGSRMLRAMLVAADAGMVTRSLDAIRGAGLRPEVVDLSSFALLRAASAAADFHEGSSDNEALVNVGATVTNIIVHSLGRPRFVRILTLGGEDITESLAERLGIPRDDAEQRKCGIPHVDGTDAAEPDAVSPEGRYVEAATSALVEEIRGSLDYYRGQPGARPLTRILLSGGGALVAGLEQQLTAATRLPVRHAESISALPHPSTMSEDMLTSANPFAVVPLGLALRMAS